MKLDVVTENKIRKTFSSNEFLDFMFEMIVGNKNDEEDVPYRQVYDHELKGIENKLIHMVDSFLRHNIPMNRNCIISFVLINVVDGIIGAEINCNTVKFFALCNQIYYIVFEEIRKYYKPFMIKENT